MPEAGDDRDGVAVLFEGRPPSGPVARPDGGGLWIDPADLASATGWELKPEGMCRGAVCIPIPRGREGEFLRAGGEVSLSAFARLRDQPIVADPTGRAWAFGTSVAGGTTAGAQAPDFELPDLAGQVHALSDHRGRKVVLYAWASWCSCRWHLPDWQALQEELADEGLVVIAVAIDGGGVAATQEWIEAARPTHPSLIDEWHVVTELYGLGNVPNTVWIDEDGLIVRAVEAAGMIDVTGAMDRDTKSLPEAAQVAEAQARDDYMGAVRDWVRTGSWTQSPEEVLARQAALTVEKSTAMAHHRLGKYVLAEGDVEAAAGHFAAALRLDAEPWSLRRDAWALRNRILEGNSIMSPSSPLWDEFWAALDTSEQPFYPPTDL